MTGRGALLLLLPCAVVGLGALQSALLVGGIAGLAAAAALVAVDRARAPRRGQLSAVRSHDLRLSVGAPNRVTVRIDAPERGGWPARVRDEHPPRMRASAEVVRVRLPATVDYTLTPSARGSTRFGRTVVRVQGPLGLGERQVALPAGDEVAEVDPDLSAVRVFEALARRGQLSELGVRTLRRPGEGTEFERVRDAVPDDPPRTINWRATARTGRLMASELIPERAQPVLICIDHGRLMGVGAGALTKLDHAVNAALLLVDAALRSGDRVGAMSFDDRVTAMLAPRAGRSQMRAVLDLMRPLGAADTEADYDAAFAHLSRWQRRRALLVIFTDVLDLDQGAALVRQCARLRRQHLPLVVTVRDPAVADAARARPATSTDAYARAVASGLLGDRAAVIQVLARSGAMCIDADARTLSPRLVNRYLELKRRAAI